MKLTILLVILCFALSDAFVRRRAKHVPNGASNRNPSTRVRLSTAASSSYDNYQLVPKHYGHIVIKPVRQQRRKRLFRYFGSPPVHYQSHPKVNQNLHPPEPLHHGESQRGVVFHPPPQPVLYPTNVQTQGAGHQRVVFRPLFSPQLGSPGSWKPLVKITENIDSGQFPTRPTFVDSSYHPELGLTKETLFRGSVGNKQPIHGQILDNSISGQHLPGLVFATLAPPTVPTQLNPQVFLSAPPSPSPSTLGQDIRFGRTTHDTVSPGKGSHVRIQPSLEVYNGHTVNEFISNPPVEFHHGGQARQPLFQRPSVEVHSGHGIQVDPYAHLPRLNAGDLNQGSAASNVEVTTTGHQRPKAVEPTEHPVPREPLLDPYGGFGLNAINSDFYQGFPAEQQQPLGPQYRVIPGIDYAGGLQRPPGSPVHYLTVFRPVVNEPILHPGQHPQFSSPFSHVYNAYGQGAVPNQFLGGQAPGYPVGQQFSVVQPVAEQQPQQQPAAYPPQQVIGVNNIQYPPPGLVPGGDPRLYVGGTSYIAYSLPNSNVSFVLPNEGSVEEAKNGTDSEPEVVYDGNEDRRPAESSTVRYPILTGKGVSAEVVYKSSSGVEYNVNQVHPASVSVRTSYAATPAPNTEGYSTAGPQYVDIRYILGSLGDSSGSQNSEQPQEEEQYRSGEGASEGQKSEKEQEAGDGAESSTENDPETSGKRGVQSADAHPYSHSYFTRIARNGET